MEKMHKATLAEKLGYGLGELPGTMNSILGVVLTMFYTDSAGLALALIFWIPANGSNTMKMIYAFVTYNLFISILYTIVGVAKNALMPLMTQDGPSRGALARYSLIFGLGGTILGISVTFPFLFALGGDMKAWRTIFIVYGIITTVGLLLSFALTKEHVQL